MINHVPHSFYSNNWQQPTGSLLLSEQHQWLTDAGSLTERLATLGSFSVEPLSQIETQLTLDQAEFLDLEPHSRCLLREVMLCVNQVAYVYACSVLPFSSLADHNQPLAHMEKRPLGSELFRFPSAERQKLEICWLAADQLPAYVNANCSRLLARRSLFIKHQQPLLVAECFLPTLWQHLEGA